MGVALSGRTDLVLVGAGVQAWLGATVNMPHFMASYRIVYRSREMILKHKWASIYVPTILIVYAVAALMVSPVSPSSSRAMMIVLVSVSSAYLAWHYTGQVWGMMASFAHLGGARFEKSERLLIRTGLRILLAWHVTWFLYTQLRDPSMVAPLYTVISAGTAGRWFCAASRPACLKAGLKAATRTCMRSSAATAATIPIWTTARSRPSFSGSAGHTR